jgi:transcriptional antiterminator NusG
MKMNKENALKEEDKVDKNAVQTKEEVLLAESENAGMGWFIIQVASNCEKAARRSIMVQLEVKEQLDNVGMILIPSKRVSEMKAGQKKVTEKRLYPGYIFILGNMNETFWHCVKGSSKVMGFVEARPNTLPSAMRRKEVDQIISGLDQSAKEIGHKEVYELGTLVRIKSGPFESFEGSIDSVDYNNSKMKLSINIFGRSTNLEIKFEEIEIV